MAFYTIMQNLMKNANINQQLKTQLGRWCLPDCPRYFQNTTLIMDRSNEDHCGTCGDNLLIKNTYTSGTGNDSSSYFQNNYFNNFSEEDIYYYPYTM
jgi:hypothetical protein